MIIRQIAVLSLIAMAVGAMAAPVGSGRVMRQPEPLIMTGLEDVQGSAAPVESRPIPRSLDDWTPGSVVDTFGFTYYDYQTNGTHGKQIGVDALGWVHGVWTNGLNPASNPRHVFYNVWDPETQDFTLGVGAQVDASTRAGFANLVVDTAGWAYPLFHQILSTTAHTAGAIDFLPRTGAFTASEIPHVAGDAEVIWPHGAIDVHGNLHTVSTENGGASAEYYAKGTPVFDSGYGLDINWGSGFQSWDPADFITIDVAASPVSDKVAVAWINANDGDIGGNNIYYKVSSDAGVTWGQTINATNFQVIDTTCLDVFGDIPFCNGDTLRPWIDLSILIDYNDFVHIAFSTSSWYYWWTDGSVGPWTLTARPSMIYHWDEQHNEYNMVADGWYAHNDSSAAFGVNQLMCHRPSLAQDTVTGYLYCSFQRYDSVQINACSHPLADAWVSVSTDGGRFWSVATNVTNTVGQQGNDRSERDINIATWVTDGFIHMQYLVDHSAGSYVASSGPECDVTNNEMIYQRIPVEDIATSPILEPYPLRADSTGFPTPEVASEKPASVPVQMALYANYPNPFNPTTNIQFDLAAPGNVSLNVFDVTGREVSVLLNNEHVEAGAHVVEFDATSLPSGVYFYRLENRGHQLSRKMMLIK